MNFNKVFIYPWKTKSLGASHLALSLNVPRILREGSKFQGSSEKKVINWGNSELTPEILKCNVINTDQAVASTSNKLTFFRKVKGLCRIPPFTTDFKEALAWQKDGKEVLARTKLQARSGAGIVFFSDIDEFMKAPMYVQYIKKEEEFRIHFAFGKEIDSQKKVLRKTDDEGHVIDPKTVNWKIRNLLNGFIFQRQNIIIPEDVRKQAFLAFKASELHFGAVDVIYNKATDKAYVLEINTAPGLEGSTIDSYSEAFRKNL